MKNSISSLIQTLVILYQFNTYEEAKNKIDHLILHQGSSSSSDSIPLSSNCSIPKDYLYNENNTSQYPNNVYVGKTALQLLNIIKDDSYLFDFLRSCSKTRI